jgi:mono/diheme cytochrome c family protein
MKVTGNQLKLASLLLSLPLLTMTVWPSASVPTRAAGEDAEAAATYKAKCAMCHGAGAAKNFDATMADDLLVGIVLKGKKTDKPLSMPSYEAKGMTEDQAKAMVAHMKQLKSPPAEQK